MNYSKKGNILCLLLIQLHVKLKKENRICLCLEIYNIFYYFIVLKKVYLEAERKMLGYYNWFNTFFLH